MNVAVRKTQVVRPAQVARPLKVLIPMIKDELYAGTEAGLEHYCNAGDMLNEAQNSGQVPARGWGKWLGEHFSLSHRTARRYMRGATIRATQGVDSAVRSLEALLNEDKSRRKHHARVRKLHDAANEVEIDHFAEARQARKIEIRLHRELALQLIDLGFKALATRLHPDHGGSRDAMSRLNTVRTELKAVAETRRFV